MGALPMAGACVVNNVFYDPPLKFWHEVDPARVDERIYNRYQNLQIALKPELAADSGFEITSPRMDAVVLKVQPQRFDFNRIKAEYVLVNQDDAAQLAGNPLLSLVKSDNARWSLFKVQTPAR